jgi:hypothetical protein
MVEVTGVRLKKTPPVPLLEGKVVSVAAFAAEMRREVKSSVLRSMWRLKQGGCHHVNN